MPKMGKRTIDQQEDNRPVSRQRLDEAVAESLKVTSTSDAMLSNEGESSTPGTSSTSDAMLSNEGESSTPGTSSTSDAMLSNEGESSTPGTSSTSDAMLSNEGESSTPGTSSTSDAMLSNEGESSTPGTSSTSDAMFSNAGESSTPDDCVDGAPTPVEEPLPPEKPQLFLAMDTNVLLRHLEDLAEMKVNGSQRFGNRLQFVVPRLVLEELETHKSNPRYKDLEERARRAVAYVESSAAERYTFFVQSSDDAEKSYEMPNESPIRIADDRVVRCCIQLRKRYGQSNVGLITEDKGMRLTARSNKLNIFSVQNVSHWLMPEVWDTTSPTDFDKLSVKVAEEAKAAFLANPSSSLQPLRTSKNKLRQDLMNQQWASMEDEMFNGLSAVVVRAMKDVYADRWEAVLGIAKPWTLYNMVNAVSTFWTKVFKTLWEDLEEELLSMKNLLDTLRKGEREIPEVWHVMECSKQIWRNFNHRRWTVVESHEEFELIKKLQLARLLRLADFFAQKIELNALIPSAKATAEVGYLPGASLRPCLACPGNIGITLGANAAVNEEPATEADANEQSGSQAPMNLENQSSVNIPTTPAP